MSTNDTNTFIDIQQQQQQQQQQQRKRCHGNRRDQRFRRKCRAQHMEKGKIEKLIKKRRHFQKKHQTTETNSVKQQPYINVASTNPNPNLNKRKRDVSLQQLSTITETTTTATRSQSQQIHELPLLKKMKNKSLSSIHSNSMTNEDENKNHNGHHHFHHMEINYQQPMYLLRSSTILWQTLNKSFNYLFKEKNERRFIFERLKLLDQEYCLVVEKHYWQSYLDIGLQKHIWPNEVYSKAKSIDFELCKQYLNNYLDHIQKYLNQCQIELTKHFQSYPIKTLPFDELELRLKDFVHCERKYLSTRNNEQLNNFKDKIQQKELFETISTHLCQINLHVDLYINDLIKIRQKQADCWKEQLKLETHILCKFLPKNFDELEKFIAPINYVPVNNDRKVIELRNKRYKIIQETKRIWLNVNFHAYEIKLHEYEKQYQMALMTLKEKSLNNTNPVITNGLSQFDHIQQYLNFQTNNSIKDISNEMASYRRIILRNRQRSSSSSSSSVAKDTMTIGLSPEPYLDLIMNPFNIRSWNYLSLGPSYIRLNQSAIRPQCQQEIEIKNEHKDIFGKVEKHLSNFPHHIPRTLPIFKQYSHDLDEHLRHTYAMPLPYKDQLVTREQAQIITLIRQIINNMNLIIRVTDKGNNFYIGLADEFEMKVQKFFSDTNAFMELTYNPFNELLDNVIQLLDKLQSKKLIQQWQFKKMMPDREKTELPHLYFNPKTHKEDIPVRPIENTMRAATRNISKFLDDILRPIFNENCKSTTIIDCPQLITDLLFYVKGNRFKATTLFCTFDIHNLYTMLPQDEALNILMDFLMEHGYRKVKGMTLDTIRKLASIVLKENVFVYDKKIYKQTTGGAMGSSFTLTLANIFMWKWQKKFIEEQSTTGEYFGRYIDDIFITWNKSEEELKNFLDEANTWHPNIKFDYKIGKSLSFLDALFVNNNGILETSVYHKPSTEPYVTPFISDHPRHVFANIIKNALTRAIRYSSNFEVFNIERRIIKSILLYNAYPSTFIDSEFRKFFFDYKSTSPFLPSIDNEKQFFRMRQKLSDEPTFKQSQTALSAEAALNFNTDQDNNESVKEEEKETTTKTNEHTTCNTNKFFVHHIHEQRFKGLKKDIHQVYNNVFQNTPAMYTRMIVGTRNRRDMKNELIRKRPKRTILQNTIRKRQQKRIKRNTNVQTTTNTTT